MPMHTEVAERDWFDEQVEVRGSQHARVLEILASYGIVFDPQNTSGQWPDVVLLTQIEMFLIPRWSQIPLQNKRQESLTLEAVEDLQKKLVALKAAVRIVEREAYRVLDDEDRFVNVAASFEHQIYMGLGFHLEPYGDEQLSGDAFTDIYFLIDKLSAKVSRALNVGEPPRVGGSNEVVPYSRFASLINSIWLIKKPDEAGYYRSGRSWAGPFVKLVGELEFVFTDDLKKLLPENEIARGQRLGTLFKWPAKKQIPTKMI